MLNEEDESPFTRNCRDMMSEMQEDILTELREEADTPYPDRIRLSDVIARYYDKMLYIIEILRWLSGLQYDPEMWLPKPDDNAEEEFDVGRVEVPPFIISGGISDEQTTGLAQIEELGQQPSVVQEVLGQTLSKKSLSRRESSHVNQKGPTASTEQNQVQSQGDIAKHKKISKRKNAKTEPTTTQESDSETTVEDMKRYSRMSFLKTPTRFLALKNLMPKHSKRTSSTLEEIPKESTDEDRQSKGLEITSESQEDSIESKTNSKKISISSKDDIPKKHSPIHKTRRMKPEQSSESTEQEHIRRHKRKEGVSTIGRRRNDTQTLPHASPRTRHGRHYEETGADKSKKVIPNKTM